MSLIALIGAGRWGWRLAENLYEMGVLGAVAETDPRIREAVERQMSGVVILEDAEAALETHMPGVVIATPADTHAKIARWALERGKHVLVEKPFTMSVEDAQDVVKAATAADRILMVGHLLLYQPAILWLKDYLDSGALGRVETLYQERLSLGTVRTFENSLWSLGVHDVAALLFLLGAEPRRISAWGQTILQPSIEDDMHLHMEFADGKMAHIHNSWLWPETRRRLTVIGTAGMLVYDETDHTVKLSKRRVAEDLSTIDEGAEVLFTGDPKPLRRELQHFVDCIETGQVPRSTGESAVPVIRVLCRADEQMHPSGRTVG